MCAFSQRCSGGKANYGETEFCYCSSDRHHFCFRYCNFVRHYLCWQKKTIRRALLVILLFSVCARRRPGRGRCRSQPQLRCPHVRPQGVPDPEAGGRAPRRPVLRLTVSSCDVSENNVQDSAKSIFWKKPGILVILLCQATLFFRSYM